MSAASLRQISLVYATWCPHCDPLSVEYSKRMAQELKVPLRLLDIDKEGETADALVRKAGDDSEDYIVPQLFLEFSDDSTKHAFTGFSEATEVTKKHWEDWLQSEFYSRLRSEAA